MHVHVVVSLDRAEIVCSIFSSAKPYSLIISTSFSIAMSKRFYCQALLSGVQPPKTVGHESEKPNSQTKQNMAACGQPTLPDCLALFAL